ncbi:M48 family metallopeptidase [Dokdonella sp.]|uniref:M48 family metallopeptidase n=1 Tax=Dokdonella sp. TaxID=2291710 RepID=UPI0035289F9A
MNAFRGQFFDGRSSRIHDVEVRRVDAGSIRVFGAEIERTELIAKLRLTPRLGRTTRTLEFPDGARVLTQDQEGLDAWFPSEDRLQRLVDRLERHAHAVAASIVICLAAGIATFVWGVPWMSDRIAAELPADIEGALGREVLAQLDQFFGFAASKIDTARQQELTERFARLTRDMPDASGYRLLFRDAPAIGPNALAIPGGDVVITDQLVELFSDDREFDAVLAHELGHQQHRHALRQTLRSSFVLVIAALFAGDVSSASAIVVGVPTFLLQSHYSRGFEEEADEYAFDTLVAHNVSPSWFAQAMRELDDYYDVETAEGAAYLSSHPSTSDRIIAAQESGLAFVANHPELARDEPGYDACAEEGICEDDWYDEDYYEEGCADIQCVIDRSGVEFESDEDASGD